MPATIADTTIKNPLTDATIARDDVDALIDTLYAAERLGQFATAREVVLAISDVGTSAVPKVLAAIAKANNDPLSAPARLGLILSNIAYRLEAADPLQPVIHSAVSDLRAVHQGSEGAERLTLALAMLPLLSSSVVEAKVALLGSTDVDIVFKHARILVDSTEVLESLFSHALNADPLVKKFVALTLSTSRSDRDDIRACLRKMMNDSDPAVALQSAVALASQPGRKEPALCCEVIHDINGNCFRTEVLGVNGKEVLAHELRMTMEAAFGDQLPGGVWTKRFFEAFLDLNPLSNPIVSGGTAPNLVMAVRSNENSSMVGFLVACHSPQSDRQVLLANLAVIKDYQGNGLAAELLKNAENLFAKLGYSTLIRESRCDGGWADRVERNLIQRGLLLSKKVIQSDRNGQQLRMVMRLPTVEESQL